jgi:hypothetical protein
MAILSALVTLVVYIIGVSILIQWGIVIAVIYIGYCLWVELRVLSKSCVNCFYYGRVCGLGRGVVCSLLFKKGDPQRFVEKEISWKHIAPDFLVFIFPLLGGIVLLVKSFSWVLLFLLIALIIISFAGNAVIRGSFACKYCRQREIGCPAEKLFSKQTTHNT